MSKKFFTMTDIATDANGLTHTITMVGKFESKKEKVDTILEIPMALSVNPHKTLDAALIYKKDVPMRTLTYAYAICHPDDTFDEPTGVALATRRLKTDPMGELKSKYVTCLCKDQIETILKGELNYIVNNIDKFINKKR